MFKCVFALLTVFIVLFPTTNSFGFLNDDILLRTAQELARIQTEREKLLAEVIAEMEHRERQEHAAPIIQLQKNLTALGYDPGPIDGVYGSRTRAALQNYSDDYHVPFENAKMQLERPIHPAVLDSMYRLRNYQYEPPPSPPPPEEKGTLEQITDWFSKKFSSTSLSRRDKARLKQIEEEARREQIKKYFIWCKENNISTTECSRMYDNEYNSPSDEDRPRNKRYW